MRMRLGLGVALAAAVAVFANGASGVSSVGGTITTIAGTGKAGFSGDGGPAARARLKYPTGVAVDPQGSVYIVDQGNSRVRQVSPDGKITTIAGTGKAGFSGDGGPATSARLMTPQGVAADGQGNVYIADYGNHRIRKVSADGRITTFAGTGKKGFSGDRGSAVAAKLDYPQGVAVDGKGNVYIADTGNSRVRKVTADGKIMTFAGTGSTGLSRDGGPATSATLFRPTGVAVDEDGNVYIADFLHYKVRKVNPGGMISTIAGTGAAGLSGDGGRATAAELIPTSVALDRQRNVYIGDFHKDRVRKVTPGGRITTFAGIGIRGSFGDDGPAITAQLYHPSDVAVDGKGNVYVADTQNNRVRKVWKGLAPVAPVTGSCSKSTARKLVERLRLGEAGFITEPVANVLCGSFTGPGSRAMVASLSGPTGLVGWAVFRVVDGAWQIAMSRPNGALAITAAGSGIRETLGVLAPGDSRCCPSSTRSRIWRWNGKRFVVGPWKHGTGPKAKTKPTVASFISPSRNLSCEMAGSSVYCQSVERPHSVRMGLDGRLSVCPGTRCLGDPAENTSVLAYGRQLTVGRFHCLSQQSGVTCTVTPSGKGFLIDREGVKRLGS